MGHIPGNTSIQQHQVLTDVAPTSKPPSSPRFGRTVSAAPGKPHMNQPTDSQSSPSKSLSDRTVTKDVAMGTPYKSDSQVRLTKESVTEIAGPPKKMGSTHYKDILKSVAKYEALPNDATLSETKAVLLEIHDKVSAFIGSKSGENDRSNALKKVLTDVETLITECNLEYNSRTGTDTYKVSYVSPKSVSTPSSPLPTINNTAAEIAQYSLDHPEQQEAAKSILTDHLKSLGSGELKSHLKIDDITTLAGHLVFATALEVWSADKADRLLQQALKIDPQSTPAEIINFATATIQQQRIPERLSGPALTVLNKKLANLPDTARSAPNSPATAPKVPPHSATSRSAPSSPATPPRTTSRAAAATPSSSFPLTSDNSLEEIASFIKTSKNPDQLTAAKTLLRNQLQGLSSTELKPFSSSRNSNEIVREAAITVWAHDKAYRTIADQKALANSDEISTELLQSAKNSLQSEDKLQGPQNSVRLKAVMSVIAKHEKAVQTRQELSMIGDKMLPNLNLINNNPAKDSGTVKEYEALYKPNFKQGENLAIQPEFQRETRASFPTQGSLLACAAKTAVTSNIDKTQALFHANEVSMTSRKFIASQGPRTGEKGNDQKYFAMLLEKKSPVSVDLTKVDDGRKSRVEYAPKEGEIRNLGGIIVENLGQTDIMGGKFTVQSLTINGEPHTRLMHNGFPDKTPGSPDDLVALALLADHLTQNTGEAPITVHCTAGIGRTGTFISGMDQVDNHLAGSTRNVNDAIQTFRDSRGRMGVQTNTQLGTIQTISSQADGVRAFQRAVFGG